MNTNRITLVSSEPKTSTRAWAFRREGTSARLIHVPDFRLLAAALESGIKESGQDIERVIIDGTADPSEFLEFLSGLVTGFRGDVLYLQPGGKLFLSATGRGDERVLYSLNARDLEFYLQVYGLEELRWEEVPPVIEPLAPFAFTGGILVVEDDRRARELIVQMVRDLGVEPFVATTGFEAVRLAEQVRPAIVLLDGLLPEMHGFEVARFLRHISSDYNPRIVMLTAIYKSLRYQNDAKLKFGVDRYLLKPVSSRMLSAALFDEAPMAAPPARVQAMAV
jgi:CheY-like chemotaxis protein